MTNKDEVKAIIETAVTAAMEVGVRGLDEKLQAAVNLGVTIGAATGAEVGAKAAMKAVERERRKETIRLEVSEYQVTAP